MKLFLIALATIFVICFESHGQEFTKDNGSYDLLFDTIDVQILTRANEILQSESVWNKADDRKCLDDIDANQYSLFCALYKASIDITGEYDHRKPALQQVRWIIDDQYKDRLAGHRLMDFNNHSDTNFVELKQLLQEAMAIIQQKI